MASIDHDARPGTTYAGASNYFSGLSLVLLAVAALAIASMILGSVVGIFSGLGSDDAYPVSSNDANPTIGVEDPNIVVEEPSGAEVAPLSGEAQGTTMTTVPTTPVDDID